jgi:hypothetical protein
MALNMAIGLLFLGGGELTLSRSNEAIAALLISLYPRFPCATNDNQYHLQALRHLYVLAVEPRTFLAYDIDTAQPVTCAATQAPRPAASALVRDSQVFVPLEITLSTAVSTTAAVDHETTQLGITEEVRSSGVRRAASLRARGRVARWIKPSSWWPRACCRSTSNPSSAWRSSRRDTTARCSSHRQSLRISRHCDPSKFTLRDVKGTPALSLFPHAQPAIRLMHGRLQLPQLHCGPPCSAKCARQVLDSVERV